MRMTVLASGSRGNSTVLSSSCASILVDAGISCKETLKRMKAAGEDPQKLKAIVISHEHQDHVADDTRDGVLLPNLEFRMSQHARAQQTADVMAPGSQNGNQGGADQAAGAGHEDEHGCTVSVLPSEEVAANLFTGAWPPS